MGRKEVSVTPTFNAEQHSGHSGHSGRIATQQKATALAVAECNARELVPCEVAT